jgi:CheY-like chemotaxis protein
MTLIESVRELNQKLDGPEVLSYIREDPSLKRLCVTILSSSPADVMVNRALGADYYFSKPSDVAS